MRTHDSGSDAGCGRMITITIIILLSISTLAFLFLFLFFKNKNTKIKNAVRELKSPLREGYYKHTINFADSRTSKNLDPYDCIIYVEELDRYTNGESKIKLIKVEVIGGFSSNKFPLAIDFITKEFCSVKKTADIEWLESEESLKELRRKKMEEIMK